MKEMIKKIIGAKLSKAIYQLKIKFTTPSISNLPSSVDTIFSLSARMHFFRKAQYYLQVNRINGVYAEFGCHEANTFRMALNTIGQHNKPNKINRFYAFDSFRGMPAPEGIDRQKIWREGMNFTNVEKFKSLCKKDLYRIETIEGMYDQSLPAMNWKSGEEIAMAYIDCDYYSSTNLVLEFIYNKMKHGGIIVFDDWNCYFGDPKRGQKRAFSEFCEKNTSLLIIPFVTIDSGGMSFICLYKNLVGTEFQG